MRNLLHCQYYLGTKLHLSIDTTKQNTQKSVGKCVQQTKKSVGKRVIMYKDESQN